MTEVEIGSEKPVEISDDEILKCIVNLKLYKSPGPDIVTAEHVQYASSIIVPMLRRLISAILVHGVLPSSMSNLELVPIPKDKKGKLNDQNNYRPIALASCFSKILEMCIFNRIKEFIKTESNQFGYKPGLGTDSCIYTLKEIITNNMKNSTNTFIAFLDASKAFDKINHDLLFEKLLNAGTPRYMVRVISNWYRSQNLRVRWGSSLSHSFTTSNGVKQGGLLSPHLFNFYMNELSIQMNNEPIGCWVGERKVNHLAYADDLTLVSPSLSGLQRLLDCCSDYSERNFIQFNVNKSKTMYIKAGPFSDVTFDDCLLNALYQPPILLNILVIS